MRINTNVASLSAQRTIADTNRLKDSSLQKMSSGSRINSASDDAAGLAISEKLKANIRGLNQANRNTGDAISLIQTAEGGLNEVSNILVRLRELSVQSASDTVGETERKFTDLEFQNLKQEVQRISQVTEFNGVKLLSGEGQNLDFQVGVGNSEGLDRISYNSSKINSGLSSLGIGEIGVSSKEGAQNSLSTLDQAIEGVSGQRAELGAMQNRLTSTSNGLMIMSENLSAANSRVRDTDYAEETAKNAKFSILNSAGTSVLSQANASGATALKLIG